MSEPMLGNSMCVQVAVLVHDIEEASKNYAEFFGVEQPKIITTPSYEVTKDIYRGKPCKGNAKLAFFVMGNVRLELIEPSPEPSIWRECLDKDGEGFHHIAFLVEDTDGKVAKAEAFGMTKVQQGFMGNGGIYTYLDARDKLKIFIELLQPPAKKD